MNTTLSIRTVESLLAMNCSPRPQDLPDAIIFRGLASYLRRERGYPERERLGGPDYAKIFTGVRSAIGDVRALTRQQKQLIRSALEEVSEKIEGRLSLHERLRTLALPEEWGCQRARSYNERIASLLTQEFKTYEPLLQRTEGETKYDVTVKRETEAESSDEREHIKSFRERIVPDDFNNREQQFFGYDGRFNSRAYDWYGGNKASIHATAKVSSDTGQFTHVDAVVRCRTTAEWYVKIYRRGFHHLDDWLAYSIILGGHSKEALGCYEYMLRAIRPRMRDGAPIGFLFDHAYIHLVCRGAQVESADVTQIEEE